MLHAQQTRKIAAPRSSLSTDNHWSTSVAPVVQGKKMHQLAVSKTTPSKFAVSITVAEPQKPSLTGARFVAAPQPVTADSPPQAFRRQRADEGIPKVESGTPSTVCTHQNQRQAPSNSHCSSVQVPAMICSTHNAAK
jgi:hypothetical protein